MKKRRSLGATPDIHERATRFYDSASNNWQSIRERHHRGSECINIGHYTDVVTEATVAAVLAEHAGDPALVKQADRLVSRASHAQQGAVKACEVGVRRR